MANNKPIPSTSVTGLGSAATQNTSAFATSAQGTTADTAVQPGALASVATTGASDLSGLPTIPSASQFVKIEVFGIQY